MRIAVFVVAQAGKYRSESYRGIAAIMCTSSGENHSENGQANQAVQAKLGRRIRTLREQRGWSQHALASRCGIHVSHLSKLERGGANATLATLLVVATNLNVTVSDLFNGIS